MSQNKSYPPYPDTSTVTIRWICSGSPVLWRSFHSLVVPTVWCLVVTSTPLCCYIVLTIIHFNAQHNIKTFVINHNLSTRHDFQNDNEHSDKIFLHILDYFLWREGHELLQFLTHNDKLPPVGDCTNIYCQEQCVKIAVLPYPCQRDKLSLKCKFLLMYKAKIWFFIDISM